jgi:hypothetical protein
MLRILLIPIILAFGAAVLLLAAVATGSAVQTMLVHLAPLSGVQGGPVRFVP